MKWISFLLCFIISSCNEGCCIDYPDDVTMPAKNQNPILNGKKINYPDY